MKFKPHPYQIKCAKLILEKNGVGLFMDCGTGKTATTLMALSLLKPKCHTLVVAPKTIAKSTWIDEIKKWEFDLNYKSLIINDKEVELSRKKRHELYETILENKTPTIYFINRELLKDLVDTLPKWLFPIVILDEMQMFKNSNTVGFKTLKSIRKHIKKIVGLSGTPQPKSIMDLWSQIYLLDQGERLGKYKTHFKNNYLIPNPYIIVNERPVVWEPKPNAEKEIYDKIKDIVVSVKDTSVKLPPLMCPIYYAHMTKDETKAYNKLIKEKILAFDENGENVDIDENTNLKDLDVIIAKNAAILSLKLIQLSSGCLYTDQDINNPDRPYIKIHEKKLDIMEHIIKTTSDNILIFYNFKSDIKEITRRLEKIGLVNEYSDTKETYKVFDKTSQMQKDWNNKKIKIMLLNPASAGHGLNIQEGGSTIIWYTLPRNNFEQYYQANKRLYRQGQKNTTTIHHIITKNTVDEKMLDNLRRKKISQDNLIESVKLEIEKVLKK